MPSPIFFRSVYNPTTKKFDMMMGEKKFSLSPRDFSNCVTRLRDALEAMGVFSKNVQSLRISVETPEEGVSLILDRAQATRYLDYLEMVEAGYEDFLREQK